MTKSTSPFDIIAGRILDLRKQQQTELIEYQAEAKLHWRAIKFLPEKLLARRNGKRDMLACLLMLLILGSTQVACHVTTTEEALQTTTAAALDSLVGDLVAERPADAFAYARHLRDYLDEHPAFYGSAVALLDETGTVTSSPYVFRTEDGYGMLDLATPSYNIEGQDWFTMPLEANAGIWTAPYFDSSGGEIWMITRSVPAWDSERIFAIVTTDLPVDPPDSVKAQDR